MNLPNLNPTDLAILAAEIATVQLKRRDEMIEHYGPDARSAFFSQPSEIHVSEYIAELMKTHLEMLSNSVTKHG